MIDDDIAVLVGRFLSAFGTGLFSSYIFRVFAKLLGYTR